METFSVTFRFYFDAQRRILDIRCRFQSSNFKYRFKYTPKRDCFIFITDGFNIDY